MREKRRSAFAAFAVVVGLFFVMPSSAIAWGLSDADYEYLKTMHGLERYDHPVLDLSPAERSRIDNLINDPQTAHDPGARDQNVKDALALFLSHQLWEKAHPGKMWDENGSAFPN